MEQFLGEMWEKYPVSGIQTPGAESSVLLLMWCCAIVVEIHKGLRSVALLYVTHKEICFVLFSKGTKSEQ